MSRSFSQEHPNHLSQRYLSSDTIAAVSSGLGGAIALMRISGGGALAALRSLTGAPLPEERALCLAKIRDPQTLAVLDEAMAVTFKGPRSFTGEDVVELNIHGSPFIATRVLEILASLGVRQALPGEFSFRAIRNGKTTLSQAQAVADLIGASNESAVTLALEKMSGSQNLLLATLAADLRRLAVLGEVGIDFSDQDIDEVSLPTLKRQATLITARLQSLHESYERGSRIQNGIRVAFVGLPNAGKSSFFNALLGEDRSIVSEIAGTTRDIVREKLSLRSKHGSVTLRLEDTAGLRASLDPVKDSIEIQGIARSQEAARNAELLIFVVDPSSSPLEIEKQWRGLLSICGPDLTARTLGVLTKVDLHPALEADSLGIPKWIKTSATTGAGIQEAVDAIVDQCVGMMGRKSGEVLLTRLDHLRAVEAGLEHLQRAFLASDVDLFAADVKQALSAMAPLIGDTLPDDILGKIFSDFCIGK